MYEPSADSADDRTTPVFRSSARSTTAAGGIASAARREIPVIAPATGEPLGIGRRRARADDVDRAVKAARDAFYAWRDMPAQERAKLVRKAAAILLANADDLAWLEALDTGNPFQAMRYDVEISVGYMEYFAGLVTEIKGDTIPIGPGTLNYTLREPLGVVGRIGAFNHPLLFTAGKCGAPLVTGNTLVVKPADQTPLSSLRIAELWARRLSARRIQRRDRRSRCRCRAGRASEGRQDRLHRQRARRPRGDERRERDRSRR